MDNRGHWKLYQTCIVDLICASFFLHISIHFICLKKFVNKIDEKINYINMLWFSTPNGSIKETPVDCIIFEMSEFVCFLFILPNTMKYLLGFLFLELDMCYS